MADSQELHELIFGDGDTFRLIAPLLRHGASPDDQAAAAGAIEKLTSVPSSLHRFRVKLEETGVIDSLQALKLHGNDKAKSAAAKSLENLTGSTNKWGTERERQHASCLATPSASSSAPSPSRNRAEIEAHIEALLNESCPFSFAAQAATALMMMAIQSETRRQMADAGSIPALLFLMRRCDFEMLEEPPGLPEARTAAVRALRNLAESPELHASIFAGDAIRLFVTLLRPDASRDEQAAAAEAIQKLTSCFSSVDLLQEALVEADVVGALNCALQGNDKAQAAARVAIANLTEAQRVCTQ